MCYTIRRARSYSDPGIANSAVKFGVAGKAGDANMEDDHQDGKAPNSLGGHEIVMSWNQQVE